MTTLKGRMAPSVSFMVLIIGLQKNRVPQRHRTHKEVPKIKRGTLVCGPVKVQFFPFFFGALMEEFPFSFSTRRFGLNQYIFSLVILLK